MRVINAFRSIARNFEEILTALLMAAMTILNFGNVLSRYLFKTSWSFSSELLMIMFEWSIFIGAALAYKRFEHLGISVLKDRFPYALNFLVTIIIGIGSAILMGILIYSGLLMVQDQIEFRQKTSVLQWPAWVGGASLPVGGTLIIIRIASSTVYTAKSLRAGN